jgi:hypothetical protein
VPLGQAALELPGTPHPRERQLAHPSQIRVEHPGAAQMDRRGQHPVDDPRPGQISSVPGCNAVARAWRCGTGSRSTTPAGTPWRANSAAANRPDGPAPITTTWV